MDAVGWLKWPCPLFDVPTPTRPLARVDLADQVKENERVICCNCFGITDIRQVQILETRRASKYRCGGVDLAPNLGEKMKRVLGYPSVQIVLSVGIYALVGYELGVFALLFASPLFAAVVARSLFALLSNYRHNVLEQIWQTASGQHYVFKDMTIGVVEDHDHFRWVSLNDVQKVVGVTASERALTLAYPGRLKLIGDGAKMHIRDDALVTHLGKENKPIALRFRTWVERNIVFPGTRIRKQLGIRVSNDQASE